MKLRSRRFSYTQWQKQKFKWLHSLGKCHLIDPKWNYFSLHALIVLELSWHFSNMQMPKVINLCSGSCLTKLLFAYIICITFFRFIYFCLVIGSTFALPRRTISLMVFWDAVHEKSWAGRQLSSLSETGFGSLKATNFAGLTDSSCVVRTSKWLINWEGRPNFMIQQKRRSNYVSTICCKPSCVGRIEEKEATNWNKLDKLNRRSRAKLR
jgi:hypothetical protein